MNRAAIALIALLIYLVSITAASRAAPVHWQRAGASTFGGPCQPSEHTGYRGDHLPTLWKSFAELSNFGTLDFSALGNMPYKAQVRVLNPRNHRRLTIRKRDVGRGGAPIFGTPRRFDLYWRVTEYLTPGASCSTWSGVILWRRL